MTIERVTPAQARVLDAVIAAGGQALAADVLGLSARTVETHINSAKRRCEIDTTLHLLLAWDRRSREPKSTVTRDDFLGWGAPGGEAAEQEWTPA